jgi:hypothetical protein
MEIRMRELLLVIFGIAIFSGCANTSYHKPMVISEITGFYSYTKTIVAATSVKAIQLNSDGSGFNCNYTIGKPGINKVPIKHIGNNVWASSSFGTAEITINEI